MNVKKGMQTSYLFKCWFKSLARCLIFIVFFFSFLTAPLMLGLVRAPPPGCRGARMRFDTQALISDRCCLALILHPLVRQWENIPETAGPVVLWPQLSQTGKAFKMSSTFCSFFFKTLHILPRYRHRATVLDVASPRPAQANTDEQLPLVFYVNDKIDSQISSHTHKIVALSPEPSRTYSV